MSVLATDHAGVAAVDLRDLHCETLQAEIERQQREIAALAAQLARAEGAVQAPGKAVGPSEPLASADSFACITRWTGALLLDPAATLQQLSTDLKAAKALDDATAACRDKAITDHLNRVKVWARAQKSPS